MRRLILGRIIRIVRNKSTIKLEVLAELLAQLVWRLIFVWWWKGVLYRIWRLMQGWWFIFFLRMLIIYSFILLSFVWTLRVNISNWIDFVLLIFITIELDQIYFFRVDNLCMKGSLINNFFLIFYNLFIRTCHVIRIIIFLDWRLPL